MSKLETGGKVSLNLTSRINLGRCDERAPSPRLWTQLTSPPPPPPSPHHTVWSGLKFAC